MELWASKFGDDYTKRPQVSVEHRAAVWQNLIPCSLHCKSILEVGANVGANLEAIASYIGTPLEHLDLYACEPNDLAREELIDLTHRVPSLNWVSGDYADNISLGDNSVDLVFTSGVLIHIPTDKLLASMREIHRVAKRFIICLEYFANKEEMIPYRGTKDTLWRRPYGAIWRKAFPDLRDVIMPALLEKSTTGFDDVTAWVFEKGPKRH
jgi:ubiquinone/menaquinone biosynthesis C-methylase UbiE